MKEIQHKTETSRNLPICIRGKTWLDLLEEIWLFSEKYIFSDPQVNWLLLIYSAHLKPMINQPSLVVSHWMHQSVLCLGERGWGWGRDGQQQTWGFCDIDMALLTLESSDIDCSNKSGHELWGMWRILPINHDPMQALWNSSVRRPKPARHYLGLFNPPIHQSEWLIKARAVLE